MSLLTTHTVFFGIGVAACFLMASLFIVGPLIKQPSKRMAVLVAIFGLSLGGSSLYLYKRYGALEGVHDKAIITDIAQRLSVLQDSDNISREKVFDILKDIEKKLPKRDTPWGYLAGVYQHLGFLEEAQEAYHHAFELNPKVSSYFTQATYLSTQMNQGLLSDPVRSQLKILLQTEDKNKDILTLLGMDAYQQQEYASAIQYWQALLKVDTLSEDEIKSINLMLLKARQQA